MKSGKQEKPSEKDAPVPTSEIINQYLLGIPSDVEFLLQSTQYISQWQLQIQYYGELYLDEEMEKQLESMQSQLSKIINTLQQLRTTLMKSETAARKKLQIIQGKESKKQGSDSIVFK